MKTLIVKCKDSDIRRLIHEEFYQCNNKTSLSLDVFGYEFDRFFICKHCKTKLEATYHFGSMENNIDEYYTGYCSRCDESCMYECNYDVSHYCNFYMRRRNNAIMFSNLIINTTETKISDELFDEIRQKLIADHNINPNHIYLIGDHEVLNSMYPLIIKTGKKGKPRWNKKKNKLGDILSNIIRNL